MKTRKMMRITMLVALGVILHFAEGMIELPSFPGVRLGFANIVGLIAFYMFGFKEMVEVNFFRVLFASLLNGRLLTTGFFLSLSGVCCSIIASYLAKKYTKCSIIGVSMIQACFHGIGQILCVILIYSQKAMIHYLPILTLASIPTGIFTGYIAYLVLKHLKQGGV